MDDNKPAGGDERAGMPDAYSIAEFWCSQWEAMRETYGKSFHIDLGEPTCFACEDGFDGRHDTTLESHMREAWQAAPLRCYHLVSEQFGGSNALDNMVLLCRPCHDDAPDVSNREAMIHWVLAREYHVDRICRELYEALALLGRSPRDVTDAFRKHGPAISGLVRQHLSPADGSVSEASAIAAAIHEFLAEHRS